MDELDTLIHNLEQSYYSAMARQFESALAEFIRTR